MSSPEASSSGVIQSDRKKRAHEGDDSGKPNKKSKLSIKQDRQRQIQERITKLRKELADLRDWFEIFKLKDGKRSHHIKMLTLLCDSLSGSFKPRAAELAMLQTPFPSLDEDPSFKVLEIWEQNQYRYSLERINEILGEIAKIYIEALEDANYPPSASHYANPSVWPEWQAKETKILNLRPSSNQGLPLSILHPIFARFRAALHQEPSGVTAFQVAHNLCITMANAFESEAARRDAFQGCLQPLFGAYIFQIEVHFASTLERHSSKADFVVLNGSKEGLGGEVKIEFGTGDAYMQISRVYQTRVNQLRDQKSPAVNHGAPLILICVMGPVLIVAGGFFDGSSTVVEPLAQPYLMLPDSHHQRQSQLASVLIAIKQAMEDIWNLDYYIPVAFKPALPRVYPSFTSFDGLTTRLTFESRLSVTRDPTRDLLFLATRVDSDQQVLVKLVADDNYGVGAHRKLADAGCAPTLFGMAKVDGALTAYVMEYLAPKDGWITLREYTKQYQKDILSRIKAPIDRIIGIMDDSKIVHGDMRPNNIMVREIGDELEMKLVDFDWAGESGEVRYPFRRNETISWPAAAGEPILTGHDRQMLMTCLNEQVH